MNVIVIGAGVAGFNAAKRLKINEPDISVRLFDVEREGLYAKIRLPEYVAGKVESKRLVIGSPEQMAKAGIEAHTGERIVRLTPGDKTVTTDHGFVYPYDKLILACGAKACVPSVPGADSPRIRTLRTLEDATGIIQLAEESKTAIVMGGGLLGLEAAWALRERGLQVTILECMNRLLPRQLNEKESLILLKTFETLGFTVELCAMVKEICTEGSRVCVILSDGRMLSADFLQISAGIRPETELALNAGIVCGRAIRVNERLETSVPDIYAVGDCAELNGCVAGLWIAAKDQGEAVADILCGKRECFDSPRYSPTLKISGIDLDVIRHEAFEKNKEGRDDGKET